MENVKPSRNEDEYFAKQEIEKKKQLAADLRAKLEAEELEKLKQLHYMKCSKCGFDLHTMTFQGFIIEKCFHCGAVVLDADELEKIAGTEDGFISSIVGLFK